MILASFGASVITQSSQSLLLITKGDFRKLALMDSFPTRFPITDKFFRDLFGEKGIVSVMPQLDGDYGINGEEKMIPIVEINKEARSIKIVYGYGGDHFQSIDGYTKLSEQNKKDFLYYMRLPGYVKFLRILKEFANQGLSKYGERVNIDRSFFGGLASIKDTPIDLNFKGSITKDEIERAGFNWEIVSNRFVSNRWARLKGESELILIVGSDQHADMVNVFGAKVMAVIKDAESKVIWEVASKSEVRLKASYEINRDFIQTIAGDDFDQVWRILEVAKVRKVDVLLEYLESPEGKKLLDNNVSLDLIILPSALFAPKLDCVPKAFLQNEYFMTMRKMAEEAGEHYPIAEVQNVYTPRQGQPTDEQDRLRKRLIEVGNIKVYVNPGIDSIDISSTGIRKGIVRFFQTGIIDLNLFVFLPKSLLLQIFRPENRSYLEYLASMQGGTFPKALQYLNPMPSEEEKARRADIINKAISDLGEGYRIHFSTEIKEGKSVVSIINADEVEVMSVKYNVSQKYDTSVNRDVVTVHAEEIQRGDQNNRGEILKVLIKELNVAQTISDDAMAVGTDSKVDEYGDPIAIIGQIATESNLGGIEFNKDDLKLNVQKNDKGIEFAIDPRLLQQLRSDDFSGFKPTVLDITPMTISNPVLN